MTAAADQLRRVADEYDLRKRAAEDQANAGDRSQRELAFAWAMVAITLHEVAHALEAGAEREAA